MQAPGLFNDEEVIDQLPVTADRLSAHTRRTADQIGVAQVGQHPPHPVRENAARQ